MANLINAGIVPLTFTDETDYDKISEMDELALPGIREAIASGSDTVTLLNKTTGARMELRCDFSDRQRAMLLAGGLLNYTREQNS